MIDYSFLQFIKPECIKKEELNGYVQFDSRITRFDVDQWLQWGIIDISDYKKFLKMLIERQEKELEQIKIMLDMAGKDGENFTPSIYWGMLNGFCCSSYRPYVCQEEKGNNSELEKKIEEKIGDKINE